MIRRALPDPALVGAVLRGADVGLLRADPSGHVVFVSEPWSGITGLAAELAVGQGWLDAVHPRDRRATAAAWADGIAGRDRFTVLHRLHRAGGGVAWAELRMTPDTPGGTRKDWTGVVVDVTEHVRERTETAARERIATAVAEHHDPRLVFHLVAREAAAVAGCEAGGVVRLDDGAGVLVGTWAAQGVPSAPLGTVVELDGRTATARALQEGRARRVNYPASLPSGPAFLCDNPYRAGAAAPIRVRGEVWGTLSVATGWESPLPPDVEEQLERFAGLVALSIANADARSSLRSLAESDHLTSLPNARAFHDRLALEVDAWRPGGRALSLLVLDIDRFKAVNDRHGHQVGDRVLVEVARRLGRSVRLGELVARIGGEEFAWIAVVDGDGAVTAAERLRRRVADTAIPPAGRVTVSVGVSEMAPGLDPRELYRRADLALYAAKAGGRDRVVRYAGRLEADPAPDGSLRMLAGALERAGVGAPGDRPVVAWSLTPHAELTVDTARMPSMDEALARALWTAAREIERAGGRVRAVRSSADAARAAGDAADGEGPAAGG